jgi:hypothetical protein
MRSNTAQLLAGLAVLLVAMYQCMRTLRFANDWLNLAFLCLFLLIPFLAIRVVLRLPRRTKVWCVVLIVPMLAISLFRLLLLATFDIPSALQHRQMSRELSTVQQGRYSVHLAWEETAGGALGPHGVSVEQRMALFPVLNAIKPLDYFEGASEGSLSVLGPNKIELHIPKTSAHREVERVYSLHPWLYF